MNPSNIPPAKNLNPDNGAFVAGSQKMKSAMERNVSIPPTVGNAMILGAIDALCRAAHETSVSKGWWSERDHLQDLADGHDGDACLEPLGIFTRKLIESQLIALHHSELSEGLDGLRNNAHDDKIPEFLMIEAELANCLIRIFDHAGKYGYRLGEALLAKMEMNKGRSHRHGGKAF